MFILEDPKPIFNWEVVINDVINDEDITLIEKYVVSHPNKLSSANVKNDHNPNVVDKKVRVTNIMWLDEMEPILSVYQKIQSLIHEVNNNRYKFNISMLEPLQYSEYPSDQGGHYDWHYDSFLRHPGNNVRKLSFSLGLNDEYEGGELEFFSSKGDIKYKTGKGKLIMFPSFIPHRINAVTKGVRKSLVGWIHGPNFC